MSYEPSRYDRDPDAIAWARTKVQAEIDRCRQFAESALAAGQNDQADLRARLEERTRQLGEVRTRTTELEARVNGELAEAEAVVERVERANALLDVVALELEHWDGEKSLDLLRRELGIYRAALAPHAGDDTTGATP